MKSLLVLSGFFLSNLSFQNVYSQPIAGQIPPGSSIINPTINLKLTTHESDTTAFIDIDCDNENDLKLILEFGNNTIDIPNKVILVVLNKSIQLCTETNAPRNVKIYSIDDTLCIGDNIWNSDSIFNIGCCCAPFNCKSGIISMLNNKYLAYRKIRTSEIGWIKLSYDIRMQVYPILTINESIALCNSTEITETNKRHHFRVYPTYTTSALYLECDDEIDFIEVLNIIGQVVNKITGNSNEIIISQAPGIYFIRLKFKGGNYWCEKVLKI